MQIYCSQVHARFRTCFIRTGSCICAVFFREDNNILGINACQLGSPPMLISYLIDEQRPAADIQISADGLTYVVSNDYKWLVMLLIEKSLLIN